jgi:hypothetical protein
MTATRRLTLAGSAGLAAFTMRSFLVAHAAETLEVTHSEVIWNGTGC